MDMRHERETSEWTCGDYCGLASLRMPLARITAHNASLVFGVSLLVDGAPFGSYTSLSISTRLYIYMAACIFLSAFYRLGFFDHPTLVAPPLSLVPSDDLTGAAELPTIQGLINYLFDQESSSPPFLPIWSLGRHYRFLLYRLYSVISSPPHSIGSSFLRWDERETNRERWCRYGWGGIVVVVLWQQQPMKRRRRRRRRPGYIGSESKEAGDTRDIIWSATCRSIWLNVFASCDAPANDKQLFLAIGSLSTRMEWQMISFLSFLFFCCGIRLSISFSLSVLYSSCWLFSCYLFSLCYVFVLTLCVCLFYRIYSLFESIASPYLPVLANYISAQLSVGCCDRPSPFCFFFLPRPGKKPGQGEIHTSSFIPSRVITLDEARGRFSFFSISLRFHLFFLRGGCLVKRWTRWND